MVDIEDIEQSVELPIGTRFYFMNRLYEVVEFNSSMSCTECVLYDECCIKCAFFDEFMNDPMCKVLKCGGSYSERQDGNNVFFKLVQE